jgi:PAS domain S-box-containing protein
MPELERAFEELRRTQAVLSQAAAVAHLGAWWIDVSKGDDLDANPLRWSDEVYRIFGYEPREVEVSNALFFSHVHPEDRERVAEAIRGALADRRPYTIQHRIVLRCGEERVIVERADARYDHAGKLVLVIGAVQDVTEQVRTQEALRLSEERSRRQLAEIEAIYATAPVGLCVFDRELRWVRLNERIAEINGVPVEAHIGKTPREVVPDVGEQAEAALRNILDTGEALLDFEMCGTTAAQPGVQRFWNERWAPIKDADGRIIGITVAAEEISERKRAEAALRAANEQLREADRRKDDFLGMLSHELRNPLAPIRNAIHVLRRADASGDLARRAQDVIERQTEHLARLVNDLLDVTRIAKGKIELRRTRTDLREVVRDAAEDFRPTMEERGIAFRTALPEAKVWADADATRIAQIVGNLLHNAAKFTRRGDEVTLSLTAVGGEAEIRLRDTGAGITAEFLPRIFDVFAQAERTLARSNGGLGLGLALVKEIAELHGGTVRAESAGTDRGAEFVVRLPLVPDSVAPQAHAVRCRAAQTERL